MLGQPKKNKNAKRLGLSLGNGAAKPGTLLDLQAVPPPQEDIPSGGEDSHHNNNSQDSYQYITAQANRDDPRFEEGVLFEDRDRSRSRSRSRNKTRDEDKSRRNDGGLGDWSLPTIPTNEGLGLDLGMPFHLGANEGSYANHSSGASSSSSRSSSRHRSRGGNYSVSHSASNGNIPTLPPAKKPAPAVTVQEEDFGQKTLKSKPAVLTTAGLDLGRGARSASDAASNQASLPFSNQNYGGSSRSTRPRENSVDSTKSANSSPSLGTASINIGGMTFTDRPKRRPAPLARVDGRKPSVDLLAVAGPAPVPTRMDSGGSGRATPEKRRPPPLGIGGTMGGGGSATPTNGPLGQATSSIAFDPERRGSGGSGQGLGLSERRRGLKGSSGSHPVRERDGSVSSNASGSGVVIERDYQDGFAPSRHAQNPSISSNRSAEKEHRRKASLVSLRAAGEAPRNDDFQQSPRQTPPALAQRPAKPPLAALRTNSSNLHGPQGPATSVDAPRHEDPLSGRPSGPISAGGVLGKPPKMKKRPPPLAASASTSRVPKNTDELPPVVDNGPPQVAVAPTPPLGSARLKSSTPRSAATSNSRSHSPSSRSHSSQSSHSLPRTPSSMTSSISSPLNPLEIGQFQLDLKAEDFEGVLELGAGNGGTVSRVIHKPTGKPMARKVIHLEAKPSVRKQIVRELQIMHDCNSPYIVSFYGAYLADPHVCYCMEFMDKGALDSIYKKIGPIPIDILGKIAFAVFGGLTYLYDVHRIMHRDIKPSNILCNSAGQVKICDFGVSGELINSIADTFVGTSTYMSPERIQGSEYTVRSDVWSMGITLIELAIATFPFSSNDDDDDSDLDEPPPSHLLGSVPEDDESEGEGEGRAPPPVSVSVTTEEPTIMDPEKTLSPARPEERESVIMKAAGATRERKTSTNSFLAPPTSGGLKSGGNEKRRSVAEKRRSVRFTGVSLQGGNQSMSILELLQHVVNEPAPKLPSARFPDVVVDFVDACLWKNVEKRPTPKQLLRHPWMKEIANKEVDLAAWAETIP